MQGANLVNGKSNDRVDGIILPMKSQPPKRTREKTTVHVGKTEKDRMSEIESSFSSESTIFNTCSSFKKIEIKQLNVFIA